MSSKITSLDIDACYGTKHSNIDYNSNQTINLVSGESEANILSTYYLINAYERPIKQKFQNADYNQDGRVSHAEARLYQILSYKSTLSYTTPISTIT
jgi:hypothetical protein